MTQRNGLPPHSPAPITIRNGRAPSLPEKFQFARRAAVWPGLPRVESPTPTVHDAGQWRDLIPAAFLLVVTAPVLLVAAALVKLTSRGPAFYCQTRVGRGGRPFTLVKLRTMHHNCESKTGACWSPGRHDPRVTWIGRLM